MYKAVRNFEYSIKIKIREIRRVIFQALIAESALLQLFSVGGEPLLKVLSHYFG